MCMFGKHFMTSGKNCISYSQQSHSCKPLTVAYVYCTIAYTPEYGITNGASSFLKVHCNENHIYVFLFWELRGLSPSFHIHVSVSDLFTPRICPHVFPAAEYRNIDWSGEYINRSQWTQCGNMDCGRAIPFLGIFVSNFLYRFFAVYWSTR